MTIFFSYACTRSFEHINARNATKLREDLLTVQPLHDSALITVEVDLSAYNTGDQAVSLGKLLEKSPHDVIVVAASPGDVARTLSTITDALIYRQIFTNKIILPLPSGACEDCGSSPNFTCCEEAFLVLIRQSLAVTINP